MAKVSFSKCVFVTSAGEKKQFRKDHPVVTIMGRSNVGKSTLINTICVNGKMMKTSNKPGRTQLVNYCLIDDSFYLADVPGYGFARFRRDSFEGLMKDFIEDNPVLKKVYLCIDSRRLLQEGDLEFADYLESLSMPYSVLFTKSDKLNTSEKHFLQVQLDTLHRERPDVKAFVTSMKQDDVIADIRKDMKQAVR